MISANSLRAETLAIRCFGGLTIRVDGSQQYRRSGDSSTAIHFETRTGEALLLYLACQAQPISREVLAELFWPERSHEQARTNLRVEIHRLRQKFDPYLLVTRQSVALAGAEAIFVDALAFEAYLAAG